MRRVGREHLWICSFFSGYCFELGETFPQVVFWESIVWPLHFLVTSVQIKLALASEAASAAQSAVATIMAGLTLHQPGMYLPSWLRLLLCELRIKILTTFPQEP